MAVIEYEERASASGDVAVLEVHIEAAQGAALLAGAGDEPQPDRLVRSDAELVAAMLAHTKPVAPNRFAD